MPSHSQLINKIGIFHSIVFSIRFAFLIKSTPFPYRYPKINIKKHVHPFISKYNFGQKSLRHINKKKENHQQPANRYLSPPHQCVCICIHLSICCNFVPEPLLIYQLLNSYRWKSIFKSRREAGSHSNGVPVSGKRALVVTRTGRRRRGWGEGRARETGLKGPLIGIISKCNSRPPHIIIRAARVISPYNNVWISLRSIEYITLALVSPLRGRYICMKWMVWNSISPQICLLLNEYFVWQCVC